MAAQVDYLSRLDGGAGLQLYYQDPGRDSPVRWPPSWGAMSCSINTHSSTLGMAGIKLCFLKSDKWCLGKEPETSAS